MIADPAIMNREFSYPDHSNGLLLYFPYEKDILDKILRKYSCSMIIAVWIASAGKQANRKSPPA